MKHTIQPFFLIFISSFLLFSNSCVSKKKFLQEVSNKMACDSVLQTMNSHNMTLNREIANLKLDLAEKTGEATAYRDVLDKRDEQLDNLKAEIRKLTNQSLSQQELLDGTLQSKEAQIAELDTLIKSFQMAITAQEQEMERLIGKVAGDLYDYSNDDVNMYVRKGLGHINLSDKLLFKKGTTKLTSKGYEVLEIIAQILYQYPRMDILVLGHTDSQPVRNKNLKDNWDLSVLRATPIVRTLTKEYGLNPNQVTAGGKGDSKPSTSNDSSEGRAQNRRTEIVISPPTEQILKLVMESY